MGGQCGEPVGPTADTGYRQCRPVSRLLARERITGQTLIVDGGAIIRDRGVCTRRCSSASRGGDYDALPRARSCGAACGPRRLTSPIREPTQLRCPANAA